MKKGSLGTNASTLVCIKKEPPIECDCTRCGHGKRAGSTIYCTIYDEFSPKRKKCARYWCVKPIPKSSKVKETKKSSAKRQVK